MAITSQRNYVTLPENTFRSGVSPRAIAVLGNLCTHKGDATISTIARELDMSPNTVVAAIDDLETAGIVERVRLQSEGGRFARNSYKINLDTLASPKGGDK